jgi:hypothetical protein
MSLLPTFNSVITASTDDVARPSQAVCGPMCGVLLGRSIIVRATCLRICRTLSHCFSSLFRCLHARTTMELLPTSATKKALGGWWDAARSTPHSRHLRRLPSIVFRVVMTSRQIGRRVRLIVSYTCLDFLSMRKATPSRISVVRKHHREIGRRLSNHHEVDSRPLRRCDRAACVHAQVVLCWLHASQRQRGPISGALLRTQQPNSLLHIHT